MISFDDGFGLFDDAAGDFDDGGVVNSTAVVTGIEATSAFQTVTASGIQSPTATVSGIELTSAFGTVSAFAGSKIELAGLEATASVSEVIALGTGSGIATVEGVASNATTGTVTAVGQASKKGRKSNAKFLPFTARPVTIQRDGRATLTTQTLTSGFAEPTAAGTTSGRANVRGLQLKTVCRVPSVDAIINPTDDELIWLLAA
jgi:hypothetical protein